eukprot:4122096-Ditylum_brightwellii.AAC.1
MKPAKGTTVVTVGNDESIIEGDGWGNDEGLTGIMFCINGVTKSYKDTLMHQCFRKDHAHSTDNILQQAGAIINRNWVLLDSQSTVNVFFNAKMPTNIRKAGRSLEIYISGRTSSTDLIDDLAGFKMV